MSERLLRFTCNDNVQCAIKVHGRCHCEGLFRSNLPAFISSLSGISLEIAFFKNLLLCVVAFLQLITRILPCRSV
ncbi:MAG: hypothetical protein PGMFKBFP_01839 [Anaerolineales bacterium]|nr:hypothetical protein [Anaerolineales bacterium]